MFQAGLKGIVAAETSISYIDGEKGKLIYRGYPANELALTRSYEEVAYLLWYGHLPERHEAKRLTAQLKAYRELPEDLKIILDHLPEDMEMMSMLRTAISALGDATFTWEPTIEQSIHLTAIMPTLIAYWYRKQKKLPFIEPSNHYNHVANYLYMLTGEHPTPEHVKELETYMILTLEHGMNASTFSARVTISTQSDLVSAITSSIGTMKGPLHGGAPSDVIRMLTEIHTKDRAESWIRSKLDNGEKLMGFGHRVYKTIDPRAIALKQIAIQVAKDDAWLDLALHVEQVAVQLLEVYKPGRQLYTNVEFYAAAVMRSLKMEEDLFTPTFTASRIVGWTAHVLEQVSNNVIYRPSSTYIGRNPQLVKE